MKQIFTFLASVVLTATTYAQVGIGTTNPNTSAALDITSTTKGFLPPRMTTTERNAIGTPATGLVIFNTTTNGLEVKSSTGWTSLTTDNVTITEDNTSSVALYPVFVSNNVDSLALKVDKTITPLSYTPSTGEFLSQSFASTNNNGTVFSRLSSTQLQVADVPSNIVTITSNQISVGPNPSDTKITPTSVTSTNFTGALSGNATTATNIAGGDAGRISYQTGAGTTSFIAVGNGGQYLQSNGSAAPTWVNQNLAATVSFRNNTTGTTNFPSSGTATLTANFNSSYSSVTRYPVTISNSNGPITINVNTYTLSGGLAGGQYTIVLEITMNGNAGTTLNFNGTGIATGAKYNFTSITNTYGGTTATKYIVLTFAYDGTNYFLSGSLFN